MNKKNEISNVSELALKNYSLGNFYKARVLAKKILAQEKTGAYYERAKAILTMSSIDPWALSLGFLVLLFVLIITYVVAY